MHISGSCSVLWLGFSRGSVVKNLPASSGDTKNMSLIPKSGRSPGEGNGNPLQYSCLENPMNREAWRVTVCGVTKRHHWAQIYILVQLFCCYYNQYHMWCLWNHAFERESGAKQKLNNTYIFFSTLSDLVCGTFFFILFFSIFSVILVYFWKILYF